MDLSKLFNKAKKPLILDGAIGSVLQSRIDPANPLWSSAANIDQPDKVVHLHKEYIEAGADIITTNTFRTNYSSFQKSNINIDYSDFVRQSVELTKQAIGNKTIFIAGSNAPAEDCYQIERTVSQNDLKYNHEKHIELLWQSGVDFVLNETQSHLDEIEIISNFCSNNKIPFAVSLYLNNNLELLSGHKLHDVIQYILNYSPLFIGFNCIKDDLLERIVEKIELNFNWGFYLNLGSGEQTSEIIECGISQNEYSETIKRYLRLKPVLVGACCGSTPSHIKALRKKIDEIY